MFTNNALMFISVFKRKYDLKSFESFLIELKHLKVMEKWDKFC
jgi:hypothetical protein